VRLSEVRRAGIFDQCSVAIDRQVQPASAGQACQDLRRGVHSRQRSVWRLLGALAAEFREFAGSVGEALLAELQLEL
jgi:hypothetical protein